MAKGDQRKIFDEMMAKQREINNLSEKLEKSLGAQLQMQRDMAALKQNIAHLENERLKKQQAVNEITAEEKKLNDEIEKQEKRGATAYVKFYKKKLALLQAEKGLRLENLAIAEEEVKVAKEGLEVMEKAVAQSSKLKAIGKSTVNFAKKWGWDKLKAYGVFEMDKEIRNAARSMGVGGKHFRAFSENLEMAGKSTMAMGVNTKQLAVMQRGYSEAIGRSVALTQTGLKAMAEMAEGTGLGQEYAIGMAGAMDNFGASVETTRDLVEDTMQTAEKMGVNGAMAAKALQSNLKIAQRYNFKGGTAALAKMSADALRLKLDMDGIAGLADKVFRPEGAIEMAAQLTTMGGEFAKLGDPMTLMFKARNDFEGFSKDIGRASKEFVKYNAETGTFEAKSGLARDRMREISQITGIAVDKLQEMAGAQAKIDMIGEVTPIGFNQEDKEFISSIAEVGKNGEIKIKASGSEFNGKLLKDLTAADMERLRGEKESLEKRAEQSRTAQEDLEDILTSFKELLIPVAQALKDNIGMPLKNMLSTWNKEKFYEKIRNFVKVASEVVTSIIGFGVKIAEFLGPKGIGLLVGALVAGKFLGPLLDLGKWFINGKMLGMGFNSVAGGGGGMGGPGGPGGGGGASRLFNTRNTRAMSRLGISRSSQIGMNFKGAMRSGGAIGGGILAGGMAAYDEWSENSASGMKASENAARTAAKGVGAGVGAWGGAAAGAAIGSVVVPVVGTAIGALIGGAIGGLAGGGLGEAAGDLAYGGETLSSAGQMNDGIIKFNPKDKFVKVNDALVASTNEGQLHKAVDRMGYGNGSSEVIHKHEKQSIDININGIGSDSALAMALVDNFIKSPHAMQKLTSEANATRANVSNMGKTSGNPRF